jgi:universal stress protein A
MPYCSELPRKRSTEPSNELRNELGNELSNGPSAETGPLTKIETTMTIQKILTALESNDEGKHVWEVTSRVAKDLGAQSRVVNVIKPASNVYTDLDFAPIAGYLTDWLKQAVQSNLKFLKETTGLSDEDLLVSEGNPATEIADAAKEFSANLLIMGVHNRRGFQRLLGSTTHAVLNATDCDVLAVHPDSSNQAYKNVLIAVETGDHMANVLERASIFTKGANVKILSVIPPLTRALAGPDAAAGLTWSFAELSEEIKKQTQSKVDAAAEASGFSASTVELHMGDPKTEILAAAKAFDVDLIVMGSNNRSAINRMLIGSTTRGVLNRTPCDVLICRN